MARRPNSSKQTESVLAALLGSVEAWRHGYDLSRETGLRSGTLYPILIRLEGQGWLEARWEDEPAPGKPRRHLYRLTGLGAHEARAAVKAAAETSAVAAKIATATGGAE
ncbi:MAG: PadR family transcriptional regulator [Chloroflexi bacterium]|nr:PadR family transcriptional regulator [Chloroflexota bacterium]